MMRVLDRELARLRAEDEVEYYDQLRELAEQARQDATPTLLRLERAIQEYESKFGMSSIDLRAGIASGKITETRDYCDWLLTLRRIEMLEGCEDETR